jgi:hypothetical protein
MVYDLSGDDQALSLTASAKGVALDVLGAYPAPLPRAVPATAIVSRIPRHQKYFTSCFTLPAREFGKGCRHSAQGKALLYMKYAFSYISLKEFVFAVHSAHFI